MVYIHYQTSRYSIVASNGVLQVAEKGAGAKAGLIPTRRGLAGNIVLGDIIVGVNGAPVSKNHCFFAS